MAKKTSVKNEGETKEQKFQRLCPARVNSALDKIRLVKNIFASKQYEMNEVQMQKVFTVLQNAVNEIDIAFQSRSKSKEEIAKFEL